MAKIYLPYRQELDLLTGPELMAVCGPRKVFGSLPCLASCLSSFLGVELDDLSNSDRLTLVTLQDS